VVFSLWVAPSPYLLHAHSRAGLTTTSRRAPTNATWEVSPGCRTAADEVRSLRHGRAGNPRLPRPSQRASAATRRVSPSCRTRARELEPPRTSRLARIPTQHATPTSPDGRDPTTAPSGASRGRCVVAAAELRPPRLGGRAQAGELRLPRALPSCSHTGPSRAPR
jgi:hypothetical protein